jgi:hypothetical protein
MRVKQRGVIHAKMVVSFADRMPEHYTAYINSHPDWELAGVYADEDITYRQFTKVQN